MTLIQTIKEEYKVIEDYQTVKSDLYRGNAFVEFTKLNIKYPDIRYYTKVFINRSHVIQITKID